MLATRMRQAAAATSAVAYRHFRLFVVANNGNSNDLRVGELEIMVGATAHPTSNMTSNTAPSPLVAVASSEDQASLAAWKAFDGTGNLANSWQSTTGQVTNEWVKIDLGSGNEIVPDAYKVNGSETRAAKDFRLEGSNTGSFAGEEDILDTQTGITSWGVDETKTFTL